jgi:glutathione S-transferase
MAPLVLHEDPRSGNCYKIRLTAAHVGVPLERRAYDILAGETRTEAFLATVNPDGRIPVLQIGPALLPESNAACCYLADGSPLIPPDRLERAGMLRWLFWEQYSHEPNIATLRFWRRHVGVARLTEAQRAAIPGKEVAGMAALRLLDRHLATRQWLAGTALSVADLCLYAYTHVAEEGGFDLAAVPNVGRWLAAIAAHPAHLVMDA